MQRFATLKNRSSATFLRAVGISLDQCLMVRDKMVARIQVEQEAQPLKKRGKKAVTLTVEDKLLLTLSYLRHSPTFAQLGHQCGIGESYAYKVSPQDLDRLVKVLGLPGRKALQEQHLAAILVDVTEQPMERPTRHQGAWYSGKKTADDQSATDGRSVQPSDSARRLRQRPYP